MRKRATFTRRASPRTPTQRRQRQRLTVILTRHAVVFSKRHASIVTCTRTLTDLPARPPVTRMWIRTDIPEPCRIASYPAQRRRTRKMAILDPVWDLRHTGQEVGVIWVGNQFTKE